jgi:glycosyltransferase involved in cell wall biosynthesis
MRVLLNGLQSGNRSGTGRYVNALCQALPQAAPDLETVLLWPSDEPLPEMHDKVEVVNHSARLLSRLSFDHLAVRKLARSKNIDLLHYPASTGCFFPPRPTVQTVHDLCFMRHPGWFPASKVFYYRQFIGPTARKADLILADSQSTAEDIRALLLVPEERIRVTPLGVGAEFYPRPQEEQETVRAKYGLPEQFCLFVGTLEPRKNLVRLIHAWDKAYEAGLPDLVVAGRQGWKADPILAAISQVKHKNKLHLPGFIPDEDLPALLTAARAFVWPSLMEGFGLPPLEAMACGTPVLTSNVSSIPEVVGHAAMLVDPTSEGQLSQAMVALAHDDRLCASLSVSGRQQAALFPWTKTAELTAAAYRELA